MRICLVVSGDRHTGAAAVAELMCRALLVVGEEGRLVYVGGRNLEHRLADAQWAYPVLVRDRSPVQTVGNVRRLWALTRNCDVVISHLPHDHALCVAAGVHRRSLLVRNLRHPEHLDAHSWYRWLLRHASGIIVAHSGLLSSATVLRWGVPKLVLPVPVEDRFRARAAPGNWRQWLKIPDDSPVLGLVGKVSGNRGFDLLIEAASLIRRPVHLLAVGHGEKIGDFGQLAANLGLADRTHWLGYRHHDLPALYASMDVVLFLAAGSDHGHRAISEAQACGRPVVAVAVDGVADLVEAGDTGELSAPTAEAVASVVEGLLSEPGHARQMALRATEAVADRRFEPIGRALAGFLAKLNRRAQPVTNTGNPNTEIE